MSQLRAKRQSGFTLIELLVVILVIAILIAVALPSFLGQQDKAHDSGAKQELAVGYKEAKNAATERDGDFTAGTDEEDLQELVDEMNRSEPQDPDKYVLDALPENPVGDDFDQVHISLPDGADGDDIRLDTPSESGNTCTYIIIDLAPTTDGPVCEPVDADDDNGTGGNGGLVDNDLDGILASEDADDANPCAPNLYGDACASGGDPDFCDTDDGRAACDAVIARNAALTFYNDNGHFMMTVANLRAVAGRADDMSGLMLQPGPETFMLRNTAQQSGRTFDTILNPSGNFSYVATPAFSWTPPVYNGPRAPWVPDNVWQ